MTDLTSQGLLEPIAQILSRFGRLSKAWKYFLKSEDLTVLHHPALQDSTTIEPAAGLPITWSSMTM